MASLGWVLAGNVRDFYFAQLHTSLLQETTVVGDIVSPLLDETTGAGSLETSIAQLARGLDARITVVDRSGTVLADSAANIRTMGNHRNRPEIHEALGTGTGSSVRTSRTLGEPYFYVARAINDGAAVVRLGLPNEVVDRLEREIQRQIGVAAVVAALLMAGAGLLVARRISGALDDIRGQAALVAAGRLDAAVEPVATRELGDVGRTFNAMTMRLRSSVTELERVRLRLEATLANLSDGVVITDARGHIVLANESALAMLAVRTAVAGESIVEVARDHELAEMVDRALSADGAEERVVRHSRSGRILQAAARRLDAADERIGLVVLRDITELRRLEGVRQDFVANVSHELRTPLTSIRALVETLEAGALHDPSVSTDFLARIVSEVDRLALLVDELLDLARLESGNLRLALERVEAESLVQRVMERMAPQTERARLTIDTAVAPGTRAFLADRGRIDQVLLNLVHNAVKFTPAGGAISLLVAGSDSAVEFRIRDTGIGIDPEEMPRLFERFYKADRARRSQGTGLGLAIAKHIVQAHGGSIWVEANAAGGAEFVFTLPIDGPSESSQDAELAPA